MILRPGWGIPFSWPRAIAFAAAWAMLAPAPTSAQSATIRNIAPTPYSPPAGTTLEQVAAAIEVAAGRRGWSIDSEEPGESIASILVRRKHLAVVRIGYDERHYWIDYVASENLDYTETDKRPTHKHGRTIRGPRIHRNYNGWVEKLAADIRRELRHPPELAEAEFEAESRESPAAIADEIQKLHELLQSGALTREEFDELKRRLIER